MSKVPERALLWALFNAVGALAERLTGETLVVAIPDNLGDEATRVWTYGSPLDVKWIRTKKNLPLVGNESPHGQSQGYGRMPVGPQREECATEREAD